MKRITLAVMILSAAAVAGAQTPPVSPTPPTQRPAPAPTPAAPQVFTPVPTPLPATPFYMDREAQRDLDLAQRETQRAAQLQINLAQRDAQREIDLAQRESQRQIDQAQREAQREIDNLNRNYNYNYNFDYVTPIAPLAPQIGVGIGQGVSFAYSGSDGFRRQSPPAPWLQSDPADSIYRVGRDALNRGEWGQAARMFADIQKNYPKSVYTNESEYWEAWARYKIGSTDELQHAAKILEPLIGKMGDGQSRTYNRIENGQTRTYLSSNGQGVGVGFGQRTNDNDVQALYLRINGALAMRGDHDAAVKVEKAASTPGSPCDQEDINVRSEALNALSQSDPTQALVIIKKVLDRKDDCSAQLRRNAVFMLARRSDAESTNLLLAEAKSDPDLGVRTNAVEYLGRIPGDAGVNALEEMLRTENDDRVQRAAVRALMASDNPRARSSMRTLIDRKDAPVNLRIEAINSYNSERASADDAAYLRGLYGRAESEQLKLAIVEAVGRIGGSDNDQWLMSLVRNQNESSSVRSRAISRLSRSQTVTVADLDKLYDASGESLELRSSIVRILANRKEPEATDKLLDIVKTSTVVNLRTQAINALMNKKDPRATQLLMDIIDGKKS